MKARLSPNDMQAGIIDIHTHCGGIDTSRLLHMRYPTCQNILDLNQKRITAGVEYMVSFPMPNSLYYNTAHYWETGEFIPSGYCSWPFQFENEVLLKEVSSFQLERILPFVSFSLQDNVTQQQEHIYKLAEQFAIYGLKYHTVTDQKDSLSIDAESDFVSIARELDIPILVHTDVTGFADSSKLLELASKHPDVRFCAAHFGGFSKTFFRELEKYQYNNLFFDTAPLTVLCKIREGKVNGNWEELPFGSPEIILRMYAERFPDRIVWGSDEPWTVISNFDNITHLSPVQFGYQHEVDRLKEWEDCKVTTRNAIKLLFG